MKTIQETNDRYSIDSNGDIWSHINRLKKLKKRIRPDGTIACVYLRVDTGKRKPFSYAQLMRKYF